MSRVRGDAGLTLGDTVGKVGHGGDGKEREDESLAERCLADDNGVHFALCIGVAGRRDHVVLLLDPPLGLDPIHHRKERNCREPHGEDEEQRRRKDKSKGGECGQ